MKEQLLYCEDILVRNVFIPSFTIHRGEHIGLSLPINYGAQWSELAKTLGGLLKVPEVHLTARTSVVGVLGFQTLEQPVVSHTITEIAEESGLSRSSAEKIIFSLGLDPTHSYDMLRLTSRLLFNLRIAWAQGSELVVFTTAGLDPSGIMLVAAEVSKTLETSSAIHMYSNELTSDYESLSPFTKVINCSIL